jgi:hypothetical protein
MSNQTKQIIGLVIVVMSAMLSVAIIPQPDFILPPLVKFMLGVLNAGLTAAALYLNVRMPGQDG